MQRRLFAGATESIVYCAVSIEQSRSAWVQISPITAQASRRLSNLELKCHEVLVCAQLNLDGVLSARFC